MPNGDSLLGNYSSTQAALIVPQPGSSRYFYVFTTDDFCNDNLKYGFRYSIVDICLDSGLGDVMPNKKNILLLDTVCEKLTAVRHANGTDYWIIVHKYYSDAFYSYHLSSLGIIDTTITHIGSVHTGTTTNRVIGQLKASPNKHKLAIVNGNSGTGNDAIAEYFDFDNNTGVISNWVNIQSNPKNYYGISFSPDNSKIYITYWYPISGILQFNLNAGGGNADSVIASRTLIKSNSANYWALQLAPDGKIYVILSGISNYISVINNPNNIGVNCNLVDSAIYLNGKTATFGLPNFIDSYDYSNATYNCSDGIHEIANNNKVSVYPNPTINKLTIEAPPQAIIEITNIQGQLVKTFTTTSNKTNIDVSALPGGVYVVEVRTEKGVSVNKFIKE
jgi:hypothetical protein